MEKTEIVAVYENMAFIQFVGDQPVYTHIVELKYESSDKLACILSILGRFHVEMKSKWLNESNIEGLLVKNGLTAQGSIVQASNGGHYNWATRLYKLCLRIIIIHGKKNNVVPPTHPDDLFNSFGNIRLKVKSVY